MKCAGLLLWSARDYYTKKRAIIILCVRDYYYEACGMGGTLVIVCACAQVVHQHHMHVVQVVYFYTYVYVQVAR